MIIIPCPDSAGAAKGSRKGGTRAVLGNHSFEQPTYEYVYIYMYVYNGILMDGIWDNSWSYIHTNGNPLPGYPC